MDRQNSPGFSSTPPVENVSDPPDFPFEPAMAVLCAEAPLVHLLLRRLAYKRAGEHAARCGDGGLDLFAAAHHNQVPGFAGVREHGGASTVRAHGVRARVGYWKHDPSNAHGERPGHIGSVIEAEGTG